VVAVRIERAVVVGAGSCFMAGALAAGVGLASGQPELRSLAMDLALSGVAIALLLPVAAALWGALEVVARWFRG
jgi:hypothetical protein